MIKIERLFQNKMKETEPIMETEQKCIEKQLLIHEFRIPMELVDIIKSYCFYDASMAECIKKYKSIKRNLLQEFENTLEFQSDETENSVSVVFWKKDEEDTDPYQHHMIAASICSGCGNYDHCYNLQDVPECILCSC